MWAEGLTSRFDRATKPAVSGPYGTLGPTKPVVSTVGLILSKAEGPTSMLLQGELALSRPSVWDAGSDEARVRRRPGALRGRFRQGDHASCRRSVWDAGSNEALISHVGRRPYECLADQIDLHLTMDAPAPNWNRQLVPGRAILICQGDHTTNCVKGRTSQVHQGAQDVKASPWCRRVYVSKQQE